MSKIALFKEDVCVLDANKKPLRYDDGEIGLWNRAECGGSLNNNLPLDESEIVLESDLMLQDIEETDLALHLVVYDVSKKEELISCTKLVEPYRSELINQIKQNK